MSIMMEPNAINVDRTMLGGARDVAPIAFAALVIGVSFGILARDAGMGVVAPIVMSLTTFAGSAQMAAATVMHDGGAVAAAVAAALDAPTAVQALVFGVVSVLALVAVRPVMRRHLQTAGDQTPMGLAAIEGSTGLVLERVDTDHGMVKIEGELWQARSYDATQVMEAGERVRIIEVRGATAMVWKE